MDFKKHFSEKQTVTISVAKMENQKITKSIFSQIPESRRIKYPFNFNGIHILGYVNDKGMWVLYTSDNILYKSSIVPMISLINKSPMNLHFRDIENYVTVEHLHEHEAYDTFDMLPEAMRNEYQIVKDTITLFITTLKGRQIYL